MRQLQFFILLLTVVLLTHQTLGARTRGEPQREPIIERESIISHDVGRTPYEGNSAQISFIQEQGIHREEKPKNNEPNFDSDQQDIPLDLSIRKESNNLEVDDIENLNLPKFNPEVNFPAEISQIPSNLPSKPQDFMVELTPGSGVMINRFLLQMIVRYSERNPKKFIRQLLTEIIPAEVIAKFTFAEKDRFKHIPENIRNSAEEFIIKYVGSKLTRKEIRAVIGPHLTRLRLSYNTGKLPSLDIPINPSFTSINQNSLSYPVHEKLANPQEFLRELANEPENTMVELVRGSGVLINKENLVLIVSLNGGHSGILMKKLLEELIPREKFSTMSFIDDNGRLRMDENIRNALEIFMGDYSSPRMDHWMFERTAYRQLNALRSQYNADNMDVDIEN